MTDSHAHAAAHDDHDHGGVAKYLYVFAALCVLTGCSFFTYSSAWPFGHHAAWAFMMLVSCTKALLVMLFFMHLKYEADWKYVLTVPASVMSILLMLALVPDIGFRVRGAFGYGYSRERMSLAATPADAEAIQQASKIEFAHRHGNGHGSSGHDDAAHGNSAPVEHGH